MLMSGIEQIKKLVLSKAVLFFQILNFLNCLKTTVKPEIIRIVLRNFGAKKEKKTQYESIYSDNKKQKRCNLK